MSPLAPTLNDGNRSTPVPDVQPGIFSPVYGKMTKSAAQAAVNAATATLAFENVIYASAPGIVDVANDRFVAPIAGIYLITALVRWSEPNAGDAVVSTRVLVNGSAGDGFQVAYASVATAWDKTSNTIATALQLAAGALVTFQIELDTGAQGPNESVTFAEATIQRVG